MGGVENNTHQTTSGDGSDRDGQDPTQEDPTECSPVDSPPSAGDKTDTGSGTHDTHRGGDGKGILRSKEDGNGRTELHRETTGWRHKGKSVTDGSHDLVTVSGETDNDHGTTESENPGFGRSVLGEGTDLPNVVDDSERTNGVGGIVGAVGERVGASGEDLKEREKVLGFVTVLGSLLVHGVDTGSFLGTTGTGLEVVDIDSRTVEETSEDLVSEEDPDVLGFVPATNDRVSVFLLLDGLERSWVLRGRLSGNWRSFAVALVLDVA